MVERTRRKKVSRETEEGEINQGTKEVREVKENRKEEGGGWRGMEEEEREDDARIGLN